MRLRLGILLATALAACALPGAAQGAVPTWGMNPGMAGSFGLIGTPYGAAAHRAMATAGVQEVRYTAAWIDADPNGTADRDPRRPAYNWGGYHDTTARVLAQARLRGAPKFTWPPVAWSSNPSAFEGGNPTAEGMPHFVNYIRAFAERYGRLGTFWRQNPSLPYLPVTDFEIWNEPNIVNGWSPASLAPQQYMDLYSAAYKAIKAVDPSARVIFASMTPTPDALGESQFVRDALARNPRQQIDAFGYHPNTIGIGTYGAVQHVYRLLSRFRDTLDALGRASTPISITELAWGTEYSLFPDTSVTLTESERAEAMRVVGTALSNSDCNISEVSMLFWGSDRAVTNVEDDFGRYITTTFALANPDNTLKPVGAAFRDVIRNAARAKRTAICN